MSKIVTTKRRRTRKPKVSPNGNGAADWLQDRVIARIEEIGVTSYAVSKATGNRVSEDHVRAYVTKAKSMGSHKLQYLLQALGLTVSNVTPGRPLKSLVQADAA
jgi:hypothetical protein